MNAVKPEDRDDRTMLTAVCFGLAWAAVLSAAVFIAVFYGKF